jgi:hypothetical protein
MTLTHPIQLDLLAFLNFGKLDFIKLGQSKEWILANFPDPDDFGEYMLGPKWPIWTYNRLEFHFDQRNELVLIYTDYLDAIKSNNRFEVKPWIFEDVSKLTLLFVQAELNENAIDYHKLTGAYGVLLRLKSGVELSFASLDESALLKPNDLMMTALSLNKKG